MNEAYTTQAAEASLAPMKFIYEPYPVGYVTEVFPAGYYEELIKTYPPQAAFEYMAKVGHKYSLSELNHPEDYFRFLRATPVWMELYNWFKSPGFVAHVLETLNRNAIDLGLEGEPICTEQNFVSPRRRMWLALRRRLREALEHRGVLVSRFEFAMLPANGGYIKPHTDRPGKLITMVFSMNGEGEWNPAWGGGTAMLRPRDSSRNFNHMNHRMEFEDCEILNSYPFVANQCLLFIKTFNSHHAVYPMTGFDSNVTRRTLTVTIERIVA